MAAVPKVNPVFINVAKVYGATRWEIIRKVIWPSVLPDIISGMRVGLGVAWMCIVVAEMIGGEGTGVGRLILKYVELLKLPEVVVGMLHYWRSWLYHERSPAETGKASVCMENGNFYVRLAGHG